MAQPEAYIQHSLLSLTSEAIIPQCSQSPETSVRTWGLCPDPHQCQNLGQQFNLSPPPFLTSLGKCKMQGTSCPTRPHETPQDSLL